MNRIIQYSVFLLLITISLNIIISRFSFTTAVAVSYRRQRLCFLMMSSNSKRSIEYRNLQEKDISNVAELCSNVFDGPFNLFQQIEKKKSIETFTTQLTKRKLEYVNNGKKHAMLVAVNVETKKTVGFLEVGLLPSPILINSTWHGEEILSYDMNVPYLGNVAVDYEERRKGIGSKLIKIGMKVAEKWNEEFMFVAVEVDNDKAIQLYKKLNFSIILDESLSINRSINKKPRIFMSKKVS